MAESNVFGLLADFLKRPVVEVRVAPAEQLERLQHTLDAVQDENTRLSNLYNQEVQRCLRYEDYLRSVGVDPREVR